MLSVVHGPVDQWALSIVILYMSEGSLNLDVHVQEELQYVAGNGLDQVVRSPGHQVTGWMARRCV